VDGIDDTIVKVKLPEGAVVSVAAVAPEGVEEDISAGDKLASFEGVERSITAISKRLISAIKDASPDKASIEFGIDVKIEQGGLTGLLAKGSAGATLKVTLEWAAGSGGA